MFAQNVLQKDQPVLHQRDGPEDLGELHTRGECAHQEVCGGKLLQHHVAGQSRSVGSSVTLTTLIRDSSLGLIGPKGDKFGTLKYLFQYMLAR